MKKILSVLGASLVLAGALLVTSCSDEGEYSDVKSDTIKSLSTPSNLTATASYGSVILSWDAVKGAAAYRIVRYDTTNSGDTGTLLDSNNNYYTTTGNISSNGKKDSVYYVDKSGALTDGVKYKYEVTALASTSNKAYESRTIYVSDSGVASKTVAAEVPASVDVATAAGLSGNVTFTANGSSYTFTVPTVAGLEYKYKVSSSSTDSSVFQPNNFIAFEENDPLKSSCTETASSSSGTVYQLYLAARARNTNKYGTDYTLINTGLTVTAGVSGVTTFTSNDLGDGKSFMFVVRDQFSNEDSPSKYTYTLKGYKLTASDNAVILDTAEAYNKELKLEVIDQTNSYSSYTTYGTEYTITDIAAGTQYVFVLERKSSYNGAVARKFTSVEGYDASDDDDDSEAYNFSIEGISNIEDTTGEASGTSTTYTHKTVVSYDVGKNVTVSGLYRAKISESSWYEITYDDYIKSAFEKVDVTPVKDTASSDTNHEVGTYTQNFTYTTTSTYSNGYFSYATTTSGYVGQTNYIYVLVGTVDNEKIVTTYTGAALYKNE